MNNVSRLKQRIGSLKTCTLHLIAIEVIFHVYFFIILFKKIIYQKNKAGNKYHAYFPSIFVLL